MAVLEYSINVSGIRNIDAAFAHIEKRARHLNAGQAKMASVQSRQAMSAERAAAKATKTAEREAARQAAAAERSAKAQVRAAERVEKANRSAAYQHGRRINTLSAAQGLRAQRMQAAEERAQIRANGHLKALQIKSEAAEKRRVAHTEIASARRLHQHKMQHLADERRAMRESNRKALAEARTAAGASVAASRHARASSIAKRARFASAVGDSAIGAASTVGRGALAVAGLGGGMLVGNALMVQQREAAVASQLANQAGMPERKGAILQQARSFEGFSGEEVLGGLKGFVTKTGDLETGMKMMRELTDLSLATGSSLEDIGTAAGAAFNPLSDNIKDPLERMKALKNVMRQMAGAGNIGTVEIEDMAREMASLAAVAPKYGGGAEKTIMAANAIAQAATRRGGAESAAEASTAIARFGTDVVTKQKDLRSKLGVEVFTDKSHTKMRGLEELMTDVVSKSGGKLDVIGDIFGERGRRAVEAFTPLYTEAETASAAQRKAGVKGAPKKGEAGRKAVEAEFQKFIGAKLESEDIAKRAASRRADADVMIAERMKQLNAAVGDQLLPVVIELIPQLAKLTPHLADAARALSDFIRWAKDRPGITAAAVVTGLIAKDILAAQIGSAVKSTILAALGGAGGQAAGTAAGAGGTAANGAAGLGVMGGLTAAAVPVIVALLGLNLALEEMTATVNKSANAVLERNVSGANVTSKAWSEMRSTGTISPETRKALEAELAKIDASDRSFKEAQGRMGTFGGTVGTMLNTLNPFADRKEGFFGTMEAMKSGPNEADLKSRDEIAALLKGETAARQQLLAEQMAAAKAQQAAAKDMSGAAKKISGLNRSGVPSPVAG